MGSLVSFIYCSCFDVGRKHRVGLYSNVSVFGVHMLCSSVDFLVVRTTLIVIQVHWVESGVAPMNWTGHAVRRTVILIILPMLQQNK